MKGTIMWIVAQILSFVLLVGFVECNVGYDSRALVINGMRRILISGDIHYPRSTPEMWPDLIRNAKLGGLDVIQTYVFWDRHEPAPGKYYFEGRYDLVKFVKLVQQEGLYVSLRIGPYVCAEWNFGGLPVWLKMIPGIALRTDNQNFKAAMQSFTTKIVDMMKSEGLFEPQGGPIIISQIENEYSIDEYYYGKPGVAYMNWAAQMAVGLNTGVPWIMCKQDDAPDPLINTCNGYYCDRFWPNKPYKPSMWTENWTGWYSAYGGTVPHRPVEDLAFSVALFFEKGGSFMNYYMYHGGTNFGRTSGGPFITTSYDYDAPIDEYGLLRQPRWGHLKELHNAIKLCEPALVNGDPTESTIGSSQKSHVYNAGPGKCAAFLENYDSIYDATVVFNNKQYHLPAWSISILPDCETVVFNTAQVTAQTSVPKMAYVGGFVWKYFTESVPSWNDGSIIGGLLEQISTTKDDTDYLWYITGVEIGEDEPFIRSGNLPVLSIQSEGHALLVFINGEFTGSKFGNIDNTKVDFSSGVKLKVGMNSIALLSMTVGLQNIGPYFDTRKAGILGPVTLSGLKAGTLDLSTYKWSYKIGMPGESQAIYTEGRESSVKWIDVKPFPQRQSLTWYKTVFDAPPGENPVGLDLNKMGKGQVFVNGQSIGRYWPSYFGRGSCSNVCDYKGTFTSDKCAKNCGQSVQRWYHIPRSWLKPTGNLLVLFEEIGGDISTVSLGTRYVSSVCGHLSESHPKGISSWHLESGDKQQNLNPIVQLHCGEGQKISSVKFASFGTPQGECGSFKQGACHSPNSVAVVEKKCLGLQKCSLNVSHELFGKDPCPGLMKHVAVEALCS